MLIQRINREVRSCSLAPRDTCRNENPHESKSTKASDLRSNIVLLAQSLEPTIPRDGNIDDDNLTIIADPRSGICTCNPPDL